MQPPAMHRPCCEAEAAKRRARRLPTVAGRSSTKRHRVLHSTMTVTTNGCRASHSKRCAGESVDQRRIFSPRWRPLTVGPIDVEQTVRRREVPPRLAAIGSVAISVGVLVVAEVVFTQVSAICQCSNQVGRQNAPTSNCELRAWNRRGGDDRCRTFDTFENTHSVVHLYPGLGDRCRTPLPPPFPSQGHLRRHGVCFPNMAGTFR